MNKEKMILDQIKEMCINNIKRIDRIEEIATDVDIGQCYVYRKILDFIKESE